MCLICCETAYHIDRKFVHMLFQEWEWIVFHSIAMKTMNSWTLERALGAPSGCLGDALRMVAWHCYSLSSPKLPLLMYTFSPVQFTITWISPAPNLLTHKQGCKMMPSPTALTLFDQTRAPTELSSAAESWRELQQESRSLAFYSETGGVGIECLWLGLVKLCELGFMMIPPEPINITF